MKYRVIKLEKRKFADNPLLGWLFVNKWQATIEFEDGTTKKINLFLTKGTPLMLVSHYIHSKLKSGNQFKENLSNWFEKHREQVPKWVTRSFEDVVGLTFEL